MNFRDQFNHLFTIEVVIACIVFAGVVIALAVGLIRGRPGKKRAPSRKSKHPILEVSWATAVFGVVVFLLVTGLSANAAEWKTPKNAMQVDVTGFQWCWEMRYPDANVTVTSNCVDQKYPVFVLPEGRPIEVHLTSLDVVHEFSVPYLRFRQEAFPDHVNSFPLDLTQSGKWIGRCSEFCGLYHYRMQFWIQAVPGSTFNRWLASHKQAASAT